MKISSVSKVDLFNKTSKIYLINQQIIINIMFLKKRSIDDVDKLRDLSDRLIESGHELYHDFSEYEMKHTEGSIHRIAESAYKLSKELKQISRYLKNIDRKDDAKEADGLSYTVSHLIPRLSHEMPRSYIGADKETLVGIVKEVYSDAKGWKNLAYEEARKLTPIKLGKRKEPISKITLIIILISTAGLFISLLNFIPLKITAQTIYPISLNLFYSIIFSSIIVLVLLTLKK